MTRHEQTVELLHEIERLKKKIRKEQTRALWLRKSRDKWRKDAQMWKWGCVRRG